MKLTLAELVNLFYELNGRIDNKTKEPITKGVLNHKLSIRSKYILQNELSKSILEDVKSYEETHLGFFKELGTQEGDSYIVGEEKKPELFKKIAELDSIEKNVTVPKLNVGELFNIETDEYWPILLDKLLKKEEAEEPKKD
jgi:hypothetical protein